MKTNRITRVLNANKLEKQHGIYAGYSLTAFEDSVDVHYFAFSDELNNRKLTQISELLTEAGFQTKVIQGSNDAIYKVTVTTI